jgi:hypothetical protein
MLQSGIGNVRNWQRFWASYSQYRQLASTTEQPQNRYLFPQINDATAIYGFAFGAKLQFGFGTGCYHLRASVGVSV